MSGRIDFSDDYFCPEVRCGYPVDRTMKTVWAAQIEMLACIAEVCERHGLQFFAMFGTLLGAVRHKGYIPWDDDLDIGMLREHYMAFLDVAKQELPPEYQVLSVYTDPEGLTSLTRIVNGSRIDLARQRMKEYHGCPFVVGIDIFPLDYVPAKEEARSQQYDWLHLIQSVFQNATAYFQRKELGLTDTEISECHRQMEEGIEKLQKQFQYSIDETKSLSWQLLTLYDLVGMMYEEEESAYITSHQISCNADRMLWKKEWFAESVPMGFENVFLPVPVGWDSILRINYGDYMHFPSQKGNHGGYADQARILMDRGLWMPEETPFPVHVPTPGNLYLPGQADAPEHLKIGHKLVLYSTSLTGMLRGGERYLQKIRNTIQVFERQREVFLWWHPHDVENCQYRELFPELFEEYECLIREYKVSEQGILDQTDYSERAVELCDAFYGDTGELYELFEQTGKPMMRQNDDILS